MTLPKVASRWILLISTLSVAAMVALGAQRGGGQAAVAIDDDDIGGVVSGPSGPEAGVWVIAETADLRTRFVRIVVTDDRGRYVVPDLPKVNYQVWVRGYGLVDSPKVRARRTRPGPAGAGPDGSGSAR